MRGYVMWTMESNGLTWNPGSTPAVMLGNSSLLWFPYSVQFGGE